MKQELHVLAEEPPEHLLHVEQDHREVERAGLDDLPAAEGEQLAGEPRGPLPGLVDLLDLGPKGLALTESVMDDRATTQDH